MYFLLEKWAVSMPLVMSICDLETTISITKIMIYDYTRNNNSLGGSDIYQEAYLKGEWYE